MDSPAKISRTSSSLGLHSHDIFSYLVDSVTDYAIFVLDPAGHIASWNSGAERIQGYKAEEVIGKHFSILYTEPDLAAEKPDRELHEAATAGRVEIEGWRVRKDGSRFWASVVLTRLLDEQGVLLGFGKITRDVSDRRQAEQRYKLLVESVLDYAIFSMDAEGYVGTWNIGAERLKGYLASEIIGKHFSLFYSEADRAAGLPQKVLKTAAETGHFEGEGWRYRKDGSKFWASIVVTPLRDEEGKLYGFSKVTRDVTERKRLLDELRRHSEELELRVREREETNAELEAFAYSVSHDLRAPLRAINGFAEVLLEDYGDKLDEGARDYLNEITSASKRMNSLIQDLLEYGRLSRIAMPPDVIRLSASVNDALQQLGSAAAAAIQVDVPDDLQVCAYQQVLSQVIFNLISNALKFSATSAAPQVRVYTETRHGTVRLNIQDNGIGIAPQHQERIWNVFERLHDRESYPGSGIGLAIVKRAVLRMNGTCGVDSELGKGSTFWIELPQTRKPGGESELRNL